MKKSQLTSLIKEVLRENLELKYTKPNFNKEWKEAERYDEFVEMGKEGWLKVANKGHIVHFSEIEGNLGNIDPNFDKLHPDKKQRFIAAWEKGIVEMPIAVKFADDDYDLVGGNTRFAGLLKNGVDPKIWVVDLSYMGINELEDQEIKYWALYANIFDILLKDPNRYKELLARTAGESRKALNYFWNLLKQGKYSN